MLFFIEIGGKTHSYPGSFKLSLLLHVRIFSTQYVGGVFDSCSLLICCFSIWWKVVLVFLSGFGSERHIVEALNLKKQLFLNSLNALAD